ncbi:MAG: F0F1 ATP synthase subunit A [Nitrospirota bacterium]
MVERVEKSTPEVANIITLLHEKWHDVSLIQFLHQWEDIFFSGIIIIILAIIAKMATREKKMVPGKFQNAVEIIVEGLDSFVCSVIGHDGRRYTPFIGTLFLYIFCMNMLGLIPGMKSPSANINTTLGLSFSVFLYVQYTGITRLGLIGYIDHLLGRPRDLVGFLFIPLMFPLHVLEEFIKPISLALRLFGNVTGEDSLIAVFLGIGIVILSFIHSPIGFPLQFPFMLLAVLTGTIQALVFSLLSTVYISMMLPHEGH